MLWPHRKSLLWSPHPHVHLQQNILQSQTNRHQPTRVSNMRYYNMLPLSKYSGLGLCTVWPGLGPGDYVISASISHVAHPTLDPTKGQLQNLTLYIPIIGIKLCLRMHSIIYFCPTDMQPAGKSTSSVPGASDQQAPAAANGGK